MNAIICARYPSQSRHKQSILRGPAQGLPHLRGGEGYMVIHKEGHSRYSIPEGSGTKPASRQAPTFFSVRSEKSGLQWPLLLLWATHRKGLQQPCRHSPE
jgi:hypothetical protein